MFMVHIPFQSQKTLHLNQNHIYKILINTNQKITNEGFGPE